MKRFLATFLFVLMTIAAIAQNSNTIKFISIPVDGTKKEMISKLQEKGYKYDAIAQGSNTIKFLGIPVDGTKKEMISKLQEKGYKYDASSDVLFGEFNGKDVNISVQTVNNRVWRIAIIDTNENDEISTKIRFNRLFDQFSNNKKYVLLNGEKLTDEDDISFEMTSHKKRYEASFTFADKSVNGLVWYMITKQFGCYRIAMFYENLDNAANGDDL